MSMAQDGELLDRYFGDLGDLEPLSRKEEIELAQQIRAGCEKAKEKLVLANLRFVIVIAQEYQNRGMPLVDLIGAGNLGLMMATDRFDETRGFKFISYAVWWIRQAIRHSLAQDTRLVRMPVNRVALLGRILRLSRERQQAGEMAPDDIAENLGVTREMVQETLSLAQKVGSLDAPFDCESDHSLYDVLSDPNQRPQDEAVYENLAYEQIQRVLDTLDHREAEVIRLYFGIGREASMTLEEIGIRFNLTRERIRQIKEKGLRRLRHSKRRIQLEALVEPT